MSFLTAEWRKLAIANYRVDQKVLIPYLPAGTELDLWNGVCYVSLIGFLFKNTRLLGMRIPFHGNFEEVNLRFYVRYHDDGVWKRGVVFIKEIVPKFALAFVANVVYKENYEAMPMTHQWLETDEGKSVAYKWRFNGKWQSIAVETGRDLLPIPKGSETEFITEHYWGYARYNSEKTNEYEVKHPKWKQYKVISYQIEVDFGLTYGVDFAFLNHVQPVSVMLAEGSEVSVEKKKVIYR